MKNQKELTVRQIRTMLKDAGQLFTIEEIKLVLSNVEHKGLVYKLYEALQERKKLKAEYNRLKPKTLS